jgi:DNA-binding NarL/FixJ family response regulator
MEKMKSEPTTILIADDHALFREGLHELIGHWDDFQVIGEVENGQAALDFCRENPSDIVLMDVRMPVMGGVEATRQIRAAFPTVRVVMLTQSVDEQNLFDAIKAGAQGYILKDVHARQLHNSLRGIVQGESVLSGPVAAKVLAEFNQLQGAASEKVNKEEKFEALTERETQILQLIVDGLSNAEIGARLYLSDQTIKKQISEVMQKLHLNNRVQVAAYALRKGLAK